MATKKQQQESRDVIEKILAPLSRTDRPKSVFDPFLKTLEFRAWEEGKKVYFWSLLFKLDKKRSRGPKRIGR
jgi:hypothetical protein